MNEVLVYLGISDLVKIPFHNKFETRSNWWDMASSTSCTTLFCSVSHFLLHLVTITMLIQYSESCPDKLYFGCPDNVYNGSLPSSHFTNTDLGCGGPCELTCDYDTNQTMIKCTNNFIEPAYRVLHINPNSPELTVAVDYPDWGIHDPCKTYSDLNSSFPLFQSVSLYINGSGKNETFIGCPLKESEHKADCGYEDGDSEHATVHLPPYNYYHDSCMQIHKYYLSAAENKSDKGKIWKPILTSVVVLLVIAVAALIAIIICCWRRNSKSGLRALPSRIVSLNHTTSDLEEGSTKNGVTVFSYPELQEITNNFDPAREVGEGGFGVVYQGNLKDGREVAVKRMFEKNYKQIEQFKNEIQILTNLRHPNLVTLYGSTSRHTRELLLVYEFIPNGTLADHLHGRQSKSVLLLWPTRLKIAIQTASALCYLHHNDIIHRDIKTNNILLDKTFVAKVADFGLSRLFPSDVSHVSTAPQGTPGYLDPEYHQCYHLTDRSDVYSFGVVLVELISSMEAVDLGRERHEVNLANYAMSRIQCCEFGELVDSNLGFEKSFKVRRMTSLVAELAFRCLQHEREIRPSMEEVLEALKRIESVDYDGLEAEEMG